MTKEEREEKKKKGEQMGYRVFIYLVYYFFKNMEDLNSSFMKRTVNGRIQKTGLFGGKTDAKAAEALNKEDSFGIPIRESILGFSRQRFYRLIHGEVNVLKSDREFWEERFNITSWDDFIFQWEEGKYNKKVLGISYEEWETFFDNAHYKGYIGGTGNEQIIYKRLNDILAQIDHYKASPVYNVFYYLCHKDTCSMGTNLDIAIDYLDRTSILEWNKIDNEKKKRYRDIVKRHYEFVTMQMKMQKIIEEDRECKKEMNL